LLATTRSPAARSINSSGGTKPRATRPRSCHGPDDHGNPRAVDAELEERIVRLRKELSKRGWDAGADTIRSHLLRDPTITRVPAASTLWRILVRRGFVVPQPHKRPKSAGHRFCAAMPNERWQSDTTHWQLAAGTDVEILNIEDDHSRLNIASDARHTTTGEDVVASFRRAFRRHDIPARVLTDNAAIFTGRPRGGGRVALELELDLLGVRLDHSRPRHPPTCGKVERFHQTQKKWLAAQPPAATLAELQRQPDRFRRYYNTVRPHRAIGRHTRPTPTPPAPRHTPPAPWSTRTTGSAGTAPTGSAWSPCATTPDCATSGSAANTPADASCSWSPTSTFGSSTPRSATRSANSPSIPSATTSPSAARQAPTPNQPEMQRCVSRHRIGTPDRIRTGATALRPALVHRVFAGQGPYWPRRTRTWAHIGHLPTHRRRELGGGGDGRPADVSGNVHPIWAFGMGAGAPAGI
jgi:transposase InsO family protein